MQRMIDKSQQVQLKKLLSEAVLLLCRNGLPIDSEFSIEAMIGITLSEDEVFLVSFRETVAPDSAEKSCELLRTERPSRIAAGYSHANRNSRKVANGSWTVNAPADICDPGESVENLDDDRDKEIDGGFSYDSGLRDFAHGVVIKSEVDGYEDEYEDFDTRNDDLSHAKDEVCENGEFERDVKSESNGYGFERSSRDTSSSLQAADAVNVVSSCGRTMSTPVSPYLLPLNHKGRARSQILQRSSGSRYKSASTDQRQNGPVYLESAESVSSVEKILNAIYPSADNQSQRCHVCGAELKGRRTLMEHIRGTHLAIHSYHCPDCGLSFKWRSSLKHHRARNCTLPSVLASTYGGRPAGADDAPYRAWTAIRKQ